MSAPFTLPDLPYAKDAFGDFMSAETFEYHHGKHHQAYINKANEMIAGKPNMGETLEEVVINAKKAGDAGLFNQIGQHYNHSLFWESMTPKGGKSILPGSLEAKITEDFGGFDAFRDAFINAGMTQFGSGWAWLVMDNASGKLEVCKTLNAETPLTDGKTPLLTCDVWEHAYYIDYRNARPKYLETWVDELLNWEAAAARFEAGPVKLAA